MKKSTKILICCVAAAAAIFGCVRRTASYSCGCVGGMFAGGVWGV